MLTNREKELLKVLKDLKKKKTPPYYSTIGSVMGLSKQRIDVIVGDLVTKGYLRKTPYVPGDIHIIKSR